MPVNSIPLKISGSDYKKALETLNSIEHLSINLEKNSEGQGKVLFKRAGLLDRFFALFMSKAERANRANQLINELQKHLRLDQSAPSLLENIKKKVEADGLVSGKFLAENIQALKNGCSIDKDGRWRAPSKLQGVAVALDLPKNVHADWKVIPYTHGQESADNVIKNYKKASKPEAESYANKLEEKKNQFFSIHSRDLFLEIDLFDEQGKFVVVPSAFRLQAAEITNPKQFFEKLCEGKTTGAIVIPPINDAYFKGSRGMPQSTNLSPFSDEFLKEQIRAVREINMNSFNGVGPTITFATEDPDLSKRLLTLISEVENEFPKEPS